MDEITSSVDISRTPEDVFAYATDFAQFGHWQDSVASVTHEGPVRVGSEAIVTRRVGPRLVRSTEKVTKLSPPSSWEVRGDGGVPVTAIAKGKIEPLDRGSRSRVTLILGFEGHGIGKLLIPLVVRRQARKQLPQNTAKLKEVLERKD